MKLAAKTRNKHRGYAGQVFNLAVDYGHLSANPVTKIKKFRERSSEEDGEVSVLSSAETKRLFLTASPEVIPFLTLSFFCGIRRATLERLDWTDVKIAERRVIVPRYKGKNQLRYRLTLSDSALGWLRPHVHEKGSLLVAAQATNRPGMEKGRPSESSTRRLVLRAARRAGVTLPENAGRNTFISMHVAHYESIDKTALEADTSATNGVQIAPAVRSLQIGWGGKVLSEIPVIGPKIEQVSVTVPSDLPWFFSRLVRGTQISTEP